MGAPKSRESAAHRDTVPVSSSITLFVRADGTRARPAEHGGWATVQVRAGTTAHQPGDQGLPHPARKPQQGGDTYRRQARGTAAGHRTTSRARTRHKSTLFPNAHVLIRFIRLSGKRRWPSGVKSHDDVMPAHQDGADACCMQIKQIKNYANALPAVAALAAALLLAACGSAQAVTPQRERRQVPRRTPRPARSR